VPVQEVEDNEGHAIVVVVAAAADSVDADPDVAQ
jgi:hypothetical protein